MKSVRLSVLFLCACASAWGQQVADPDFDTRVARPAYRGARPKVLFDEAHNNFHTTRGRYKGFAELVANDGYRVTPGTEKFSRRVLEPYDILVIANALHAEADPANLAEGRPAFTEAECDAVREWVRGGGALLLVADHTPFGAAARDLAARFGVEMSNSYARDPSNYDRDFGALSWVVYSRAKGNLGEHPVTRGRGPAERVNVVETFTGQSLRGPAGSVAFLRLSAEATDETPAPRGTQAKPARTPAAGRAQGLALRFGRGRVVILGEAAMLSAQVAGSGDERYRLGMNRSCIDNRQLALNIMHWLSGLLR